MRIIILERYNHHHQSRPGLNIRASPLIADPSTNKSRVQIAAVSIAQSSLADHTEAHLNFGHVDQIGNLTCTDRRKPTFWKLRLGDTRNAPPAWESYRTRISQTTVNASGTTSMYKVPKSIDLSQNMQPLSGPRRVPWS